MKEKSSSGTGRKPSSGSTSKSSPSGTGRISKSKSADSGAPGQDDPKPRKTSSAEGPLKGFSGKRDSEARPRTRPSASAASGSVSQAFRFGPKGPRAEEGSRPTGGRTGSSGKPEGRRPSGTGPSRGFSGSRPAPGAGRPPREGGSFSDRRGPSSENGGDKELRPFPKKEGYGNADSRFSGPGRPSREGRSFSDRRGPSSESGGDKERRPFPKKEGHGNPEGRFSGQGRPSSEGRSFSDRRRPASEGTGDRERRPFPKKEGHRASEGGTSRPPASESRFSDQGRPSRERPGERSGRSFPKKEGHRSSEGRPSAGRPSRGSTDIKSRLGLQAPSQARQSYKLPGAPSRGEAPSYDENKILKPPVRRSFGKKESRKGEEDAESGNLIRLNRFIAQAGLCSRREADSLISTGQITVNGKVVDQMGYYVKKDDVVKYGRRLLNREKLVYVLLNKPKDFITTTEDPEERKTVMALVENACKERIYPVGRLDRNTTGLLLLTNDGELSEKLMHPSHNIKKIYQVDLDKPLTASDEAAIRAGVELEDGKAPVDELEVLSKDRDIVGLSIHLGRNRIVRRIFESLGYQVVRLDRVMYSGLTKKDLPRGNWRFLTEKEVINLKYFS